MLSLLLAANPRRCTGRTAEGLAEVILPNDRPKALVIIYSDQLYCSKLWRVANSKIQREWEGAGRSENQELG